MFDAESMLAPAAAAKYRSPPNRRHSRLASQMLLKDWQELDPSEPSLHAGSANTSPINKFKIDAEKTYKALNPSSSTEVSVRSDILRDFETTSERKQREEVEFEFKKENLPEKGLLAR